MHRTESIFEPFLYARFLPNIPKTVLASLSAAHALYIFSKSSKIHCDHTKHSVQKMAMQSHQHTYTYHTFLFFLPPGSLKKMCLIYFQTSYIGAVRPTPSCYPGPRSRWHHCVRSKAMPLHQPVSVTKQAASELLWKTDFYWRTMRFNHQGLSFR